ncbi:hypothetical protein ACFLSY_10600 [Bacteroidota bacterium]
MYNFISLKVKCPVCGKSLMDNDHLVDNKPGIRLNIEFEDNKGQIWLSSVYESYNHFTEMDIPDKEIVVFSCPECNSSIDYKEDCDMCDAPLIKFNLDMGGKITLCSRKGCKNHFIGFVDLSVALKKFYNDHGYSAGSAYPERLTKHKGNKLDFDEEEKEKDIDTIKSGSFLQSFCPHCNKSLIEDHMIKLKVVRLDNEEGYVMLSPYLNVFTSKSTLVIPEQQTIEDLQCPHCNTSLMLKEKECKECGSTIAKILINTSQKLVEFYVCAKKGCTWHGLSNEDYYNLRLDNSLEW